MNTSKKGIQSYVNYLLEDMRDAEGNLEDQKNPFSGKNGLEQHFMEIERLFSEDPHSTLSQYCGLTPEQFPPAEKLTQAQIRKIVKAFYRLLNSWHMQVVVPKKFPVGLCYPMLVDLLNRKMHIFKGGMSYIEFCTYEPEECPFGEYCDCRDLIHHRFKNTKKNKKSRSSSN